MDERCPGYYAVIPAEVRYDDVLPPNAKLLYGELTALAAREGYCFAQNAYFCELYKLCDSTITKLLTSLEKQGYIRREVERDSAGKVAARKIWINQSTPDAHPPVNIYTTSHKDLRDPPVKNYGYNNTSINNTEEKEKSPLLTDKELEALLVAHVGQLGESNGWNRDEKNVIYLKALEFYDSNRDIASGKPPRHTKRGVDGLFTRQLALANGNYEVIRNAFDEAIERGWSSVNPKPSKAMAPEAPPDPAEDRRWL